MMGTGGGDGQPRWWTRQHHSFLLAAQVFSASTAQLNGSTGAEGTGRVGGRVCGGVGGSVGGGVGGGVGKGVGGTVTGGSGRAVTGRVVAQPLPIVLQQKSCCAWDHVVSHIENPASQSYGSDVDTPDSSQASSGSKSSKLSKQQPVIIQVKSLRGRTVSKSPPAPMYLYVVSCTCHPASPM